MSKVFIVAKFKLHDENLLEDWKALSAIIQQDISQATGFISRESGIDEEGNVYCLVCFESREAHKNFKASLDKKMEENPAMMEVFTRIVDMSTMSKTMIDLF